MSAETMTVKASCLCGAAKHEITLPRSHFPLKQSMCHCHSCRHMSGTLHLTLVNLPESYEPSKTVLENLSSFPFTRRLTQYFCATCGSQMLAHNWKDADDHSKGQQWDAMTGSFEQTEGIFELDTHEFIADTLDGGFSDFLPTLNGQAITRWAKWPDKSEHLPLQWRSPDREQVSPSVSDKLYAHCKCEGVKFWIARPSAKSSKAFSPIADLLVPYHSKEPAPKPFPWWLRDDDTKFLAGVCYCNSCRLDTGMEWMEWAFIPTVDITLDADGKTPFSLPFGTLKAFQSSPGVVRYHCGCCGASVFFTSEQRDGLIDVAVGVLDAPEGARAESWLEFTTGRLSFREDGILRAKDLTLALENGLQQFGAREKSEKRTAF